MSLAVVQSRECVDLFFNPKTKRETIATERQLTIIIDSDHFGRFGWGPGSTTTLLDFSTAAPSHVTLSLEISTRFAFSLFL